jgi:hypothetical protein
LGEKEGKDRTLLLHFEKRRRNEVNPKVGRNVLKDNDKPKS